MTLEELELRLEKLYDAADKRQSEAVDTMARAFAVYRDLEDIEYALNTGGICNSAVRLLEKVTEDLGV